MNDAIASLGTAELLAIAAALGWASGLRLYAVVFITGAAGALGWWDLPAGLQVLQHPALLGASGFMLFVEFFADKIPVVDSLWDMVNSVVRIPAGAALAQFAAIFLLAWLAGFVIPVAPGGLGVREAALLALAAGSVDAPALLAAVLALRIGSILGDLGYGLATQWRMRPVAIAA